MPLLMNDSIRGTGIVKDYWGMCVCAKKLISVSPDTSVLWGQVQSQAILIAPLQ